MKKNATLDNYIILKTLGTGYTGKVKLGRDMETGQLRALKIMDPSKMDKQKLDKVFQSLKNELKVMMNLDHPNIVKFIGLYAEGEYHTKKGVVKHVAYAVIELASKGEIFEILFKVGPFNENLARYYMKQLVSALYYLHKNNVAHRDLKPENLLMDDKMNLKLADFGFATLFEEDQKNKTKLGTERYMSPELLYKKPYSAAKADVFAAGVILFIFYSGHPPFHEAKLDDPYYNVFIQKQEKFWAFHAKQNKKRFYSSNFKALVNGMLEFNADKRLTIDEVRDSAWLNEAVDDKKALDDIIVYLEAMNKTVEEADRMIGENDQNFRHFSKEIRTGNQHCVTKNNVMVAEYENVQTEPLSNAETIPNVIPVRCKNKTTLVDGIVKSVHKIPEAKIVWSSTKDNFKIKLITEYSETVVIKVVLYEGLRGYFGVGLVRNSGPCMNFYMFKGKFDEILAQNI